MTANSKPKEYCFVLDCKEKQLSPTPVDNAWYLIRKQRAALVSKYPMVIQLQKEVKIDKIFTAGKKNIKSYNFRRKNIKKIWC